MHYGHMNQSLCSAWLVGPKTDLLNGLQGRKAEEQRAQRLLAELSNFRHEAEKRLAEKDEEIEAIR
jgi:hypothetical protein